MRVCLAHVVAGLVAQHLSDAVPLLGQFRLIVAHMHIADVSTGMQLFNVIARVDRDLIRLLEELQRQLILPPGVVDVAKVNARLADFDVVLKRRGVLYHFVEMVLDIAQASESERAVRDTVKPALSDHPTVQEKVVIIDRWSLKGSVERSSLP